MKIYLPEARQKQGQIFSYTFSEKIPDSFGLKPNRPGRLLVKADVWVSGDKAFLEGTLEADLTAGCSRCLKEFTRHLNIDFKETFILREGIYSKDDPAELASEAANQLIVHGDYLYLDEYLRQVLLLALGYRSLCREDCRGICPVCGTDLNSGNCGCVPDEKKEEIDPRLKILKNLLPHA